MVPAQILFYPSSGLDLLGEIELSSEQSYDIAVVGASYSGLMAAITASKSSKVLLIEKRPKPGTPTNSTGAVPIEWLKNLGVYPSDDCIAGPICGVELISPNDDSVQIRNPTPDGMVLYPDRYVNWLAERARDKGCTLVTNTVFRGLSGNNGSAAKGGNGKIEISTSKGTYYAKYVVGADGAATAVGNSAGVGERPAPEDLHIGLEYHVENRGIQDPLIYRLYLGHELAPLGYAWSFPEGNNSLKVGVGIPKSLGITPRSLMVKFMKRYPGYDTPISLSNGGIIPTAAPLKTAVKGRVVLVGDAAHFCSPLHGGGIWFGMESGKLAGLALSQGNPLLYDAQWKKQLGGVLSRHYKLKMVIYSMSDKNFDDLIAVLKTYVAKRGSGHGKVRMASDVFLADPMFMLSMIGKWTKKGLALDVVKRALFPDFKIA